MLLIGIITFTLLIQLSDGLKCFGCSNVAASEQEANSNCMNFFVEHNCAEGYQCYYERTDTFGKIFIRKGCKREEDCKVNIGYCCNTELCNKNMPFDAVMRYSPEVTCDNDVIRITINPSQLDALDLTGIRAGSSPSLNSCQASKTKSGMMELTFGITQCETEQTIGPDEVTYKVKINSGSTEQKTTGITRKKIMGLEVRCTYERYSEDIDAQFIGDVTTVKYSSNNTGTFKYSMGFYEDLMFRSAIHPGTIVTVRQVIYSKIKMQSDNDLFMYVRDCYASRSRSETEVKHWFIQDGCIDGDHTFKQILIEHDLYEFEFQAFKFRGAVNSVFVVCRAIVCSRDERDAPCVPPSKSSCLPSTKTRAKRAAANHPLYMVYHGPVSISDLEGEQILASSSDDNNINQNTMVIGVLVMVAVCTVAIVTAVAVLLYRKLRRKRYESRTSEQKIESNSTVL